MIIVISQYVCVIIKIIKLIMMKSTISDNKYKYLFLYVSSSK